MGSHFGAGAPTILVEILVGIGMLTGGPIWILTHGHYAEPYKPLRGNYLTIRREASGDPAPDTSFGPPAHIDLAGPRVATSGWDFWKLRTQKKKKKKKKKKGRR